MPQELVSVMGDRQSTRMAFEQLDTEVRFQLLESFRNRGLRDRKILRRTRHRALLGDGDEILKLAEREGHGRLEHGPKPDGKR